MKKSDSRLLEPLLDAYHRGQIELTEWEENFLDSLDGKPNGYELSDKQVTAIIRMHDKYGRHL